MCSVDFVVGSFVKKKRVKKHKNVINIYIYLKEKKIVVDIDINSGIISNMIMNKTRT